MLGYLQFKGQNMSFDHNNYNDRKCGSNKSNKLLRPEMHTILDITIFWIYISLEEDTCIVW